MSIVEGPQGGAQLVAEHHGNHQAAGSADDRQAATCTAKDGNAAFAAFLNMHLRGDVGAASDDNQRSGRLPQAQHFPRLGGRFGGLEQGLVQGNIGRGFRQGQIQKLHDLFAKRGGNALTPPP